MRTDHLLQSPFFFLATAMIRALPLRAVRALGRGLGRAGFTVLTSRKRVTLDNLRHAYPDMPENERRRIAIESFRSVGESSLELLWLGNMTAERVQREMVLANPEELRRCLDTKSGAVVIVSHFAGWELILQGINQYAPGRTSVVYKPLSNPVVDRFVLEWRTHLGLKWIPLATAVAETMAAVKSGEIVILAADQSVAKESVWVTFFGRNVPTAKGPAALALKTGAPLFLSEVFRESEGRCVGKLTRVPSDDLQGYSEESLLTLTKRLTEYTESYIRQRPGQWMWTHKRWKHSIAESDGDW